MHDLLLFPRVSAGIFHAHVDVHVRSTTEAENHI